MQLLFCKHVAHKIDEIEIKECKVPYRIRLWLW